jgi:uncharacterized protein (TIGR02646 family)
MREIDSKQRKLTPLFLVTSKVQKAFDKNIEDEKHSTKSAYSDGKSDNEDSLKWHLKQIYHEKCAFCEAPLTNERGDIEHFRPKNENEFQGKECDKKYSYYWLAFSWDNMLPSCSKCNGKKSNCFDIDGTRVIYNQENIKKLQYTLSEYNEQERPKLLHPEYDTFEDEIRFTKKGQIFSRNKRVQYTVKICNLNRDNLIKMRESIISDFVNVLRRHSVSYLENPDLVYFQVSIEDFVEQSNIKSEYSLVSK